MEPLVLRNIGTATPCGRRKRTPLHWVGRPPLRLPAHARRAAGVHRARPPVHRGDERVFRLSVLWAAGDPPAGRDPALVGDVGRDQCRVGPRGVPEAPLAGDLRVVPRDDVDMDPEGVAAVGDRPDPDRAIVGEGARRVEALEAEPIDGIPAG